MQTSNGHMGAVCVKRNNIYNPCTRYICIYSNYLVLSYFLMFVMLRFISLKTRL